MKPIKLALLCSVLAMAGCGDKNDADTTTKSEDSVIEQAKDMTGSAAESVDQAATSTGEAMSDATDAAQEEASAAADQTADAADAGMEATSDMADETVTAMGDTVDAGQEMAADAATEVDEAASAAADEAADAAAAVVPAAGSDTTAGMDLTLGKTVYEGKCQACHATGAAGAPKMGDTANWAPRIAQGMDTLVKHSIEGFKGTIGYMPPKGGFTSLSDDEVKAAVAYMVSENQ